MGFDSYLIDKIFSSFCAKLKNVFFDGGSASKQAFLGKHVDVWVINGSVMRKVKKQVRPLAVMGANRVSYFPETPTFKELGYLIEVYTYRAIVTKTGVESSTEVINEEARPFRKLWQILSFKKRCEKKE